MAGSNRQSDISSFSMCQVSSAKEHQYSSEAEMNTSFLSEAYPVTKQLTIVSCAVQDSSGQIVMGVTKRTLAKDWQYESYHICPYGIHIHWAVLPLSLWLHHVLLQHRTPGQQLLEQKYCWQGTGVC